MKRQLIAGFGDIARRAVPLLETRFEIWVLESTRILPTRTVAVSVSAGGLGK